CVRDPGYFDFW
nr:immunoglobulin heavy chain junction region [Mus musculus]